VAPCCSLPFDPEAANLMFSLVSSRYERASMIVTSNKPFSAWGEIFGDDAYFSTGVDPWGGSLFNRRNRDTSTGLLTCTPNRDQV
jgi:IstB-like ATP binding protein